jgi:hypothetical protein
VEQLTKRGAPGTSCNVGFNYEQVSAVSYVLNSSYVIATFVVACAILAADNISRERQIECLQKRHVEQGTV